MDDPWQPRPDAIREWAYTPDAKEPCQDWHLALLWSCHEKALLECAADDGCPNQTYMLGILYLVVGDAVRSNFRSRGKPIIEAFLARGDAYEHQAIRLWQERSRTLLRDPHTFDYDQWCAGGLARTAHS
ncbi:MAG: hypothetical protein WD030_10990 [Pirellulales bacterium]